MTPDLLLVLPLLVPLTAAVLCLFASGRPAVQRWLGVLGATGLLAASVALTVHVVGHGPIAVQSGNWPAPRGITLVADLFSTLVLTVCSLAGLAVVLTSLADLDRRREAAGFHALVQTLMLGVAGAFLTGDLFNLYVWFEVLLISSFVLLALGGSRRQIRAAVRYFVLNLLSSAFFLAAIGILYGKVHTLNLADLALGISGAVEPRLLTAVAFLFLVAFGLKAAVFPFFFWLPPSYPTPPAVVSALFAGLLTKVGVYATIRVFTLLFVHDPGTTHRMLLWIAGTTMVIGVLGAVAQGGIRRILSFHIVSQIGYMILGLALLTPLALAGAVFYLLHHVVVKTALFLIGGWVHRSEGTGDLARLGGLLQRRPLVAAGFGIAALSLAGLPPTSGFWAKLVLVRASLEAEAWVAAGVALGVGLLTLLSMTKIWTEVFWKPAPDSAPAGTAGTAERRTGRATVRGDLVVAAPIALLLLASLGIAFGAGALFPLAERAAEELLEPSAYIETVLGPEAMRGSDLSGGAP